MNPTTNLKRTLLLRPLRALATLTLGLGLFCLPGCGEEAPGSLPPVAPVQVGAATMDTIATGTWEATARASTILQEQGIAPVTFGSVGASMAVDSREAARARALLTGLLEREALHLTVLAEGWDRAQAEPRAQIKVQPPDIGRGP